MSGAFFALAVLAKHVGAAHAKTIHSEGFTVLEKTLSIMYLSTWTWEMIHKMFV